MLLHSTSCSSSFLLFLVNIDTDEASVHSVHSDHSSQQGDENCILRGCKDKDRQDKFGGWNLTGCMRYNKIRKAISKNRKNWATEIKSIERHTLAEVSSEEVQPGSDEDPQAKE